MFYLILLIAGVLQGVMISLNAQLGRFYSMFGITFFVHGIALVLLLVYLLLIKKQRIRLRGAPLYVYLVGLLGITVVASSSRCTMQIGAGAVMALSTVGELIASELIDLFGLFGMRKTAPSKRQLPGFLLVAAGVALVVTSGS